MLNISGIISGVGNIIDDLSTSGEERMKAEIDIRKINASIAVAQIEVNKIEASSKSLFVSGWRPACGWAAVIAIFYQFTLYPVLLWLLALFGGVEWVGDVTPPPIMDTTALWTMITGMLGIAGMRSYDKRNGKQTDKI